MSLSCLYRLDLYRIKLLIVELKELGKKKKNTIRKQVCNSNETKKIVEKQFFF